jgi:hypothetical protein
MQLNHSLSIYLQFTHLPSLIFSIVIFFYFIGKLMSKDSATTMQQILISPDLEIFKGSAVIIMRILGIILLLFGLTLIAVLIILGLIEIKNYFNWGRKKI